MILSLLACSSEATPESPDIESQIDDYTKAIELEPNNGKAYNNRGASYYNLGEYEKAIDDYRKIVVQVWYPATNISGKPMPYLDQWERRIGPIAEQIDIPSILIRSIKNVQSNSYLNAEIKNTNIPYPLIVFSHGLGGNRIQNTANIESLASNGYVVFSIEHTYDSNITVFNDTTFAEFDSYLPDKLL